jgi:xylulokinase
MPLVLGVDSSTHATRVELRDAEDGRLFASGASPHPPVYPPVAEQDPDVWWNALVEARHDAGGALGVAGVAVAAQQHGLVVLDEENRVIRPAKLSSDTEAAPDAARLVDALGGSAEWAIACGSVPAASFSIAKLAWLARTEPESFGRVARVLHVHDWLTLRLSRRYVTDRGDASSTGYWSPRENRWRADLLELVDPNKDWGACLPRVLGPEEPAGDRQGVLIGAGTGDNMAAALGLGLQPRDVVVSLGRSARIFTVRERPTEDPSGAVDGFADATGRFMPLVSIVNATGVTAAVARLLGVDAHRFEQLALNAPPGAGGVTLVPYFEPERTPHVHDSSGLMTGLRSDTEPEQIARAAVEGVVCGLIDALDALRAADVPVGGRLYLIGEAARSHAFQRVLADLLERPVGVPKGDRIAAGASVQAAATVLRVPADEVAEAWRLGQAHEVEPDPRVDAPEIRAAYAKARDLAY